MINFCRTLQERFYIESFATNFSNVLRENFVLPSLPLLSSYSSVSLPSVAVSVPLASYILFIPSVPSLTVFLLPSLLYVLSGLSLFLLAVFVSYDSSTSLYFLYLFNSLDFFDSL